MQTTHSIHSLSKLLMAVKCHAPSAGNEVGAGRGGCKISTVSDDGINWISFNTAAADHSVQLTWGKAKVIKMCLFSCCREDGLGTRALREKLKLQNWLLYYQTYQIILVMNQVKFKSDINHVLEDFRTVDVSANHCNVQGSHVLSNMPHDIIAAMFLYVASLHLFRLNFFQNT